MSQGGSIGNGGGGGGGVTTITGDTGSITGSSVTIFADVTAKNCGSTVSFVNSGTTSTLNVSNGFSTCVGNGAGNAAGTSLTAFGFNACQFATTIGTTGIGINSLFGLIDGDGNTGVGYGSGGGIVHGIQNTAIGHLALQNNDVSNCTALGWFALNSSLGDFNVAIGNASMQAVTGDSNTAVGYFSMGFNNGAAALNSAFGNQSLYGIATGTNNIGIGNLAMPNNAGGNYNICIGDNVGFAYQTGTESSNILIGNTGVNAENNVMRLGTDGSGTGQVNACYIAGINGVTVTGTAVLCAADGQLGTISSSIRYKENVQDIADSVSVLQLKPRIFNYKNKTETSYGLIAEEVEKDFQYLCHYNKEGTPESVKYHELPVLLLKEIQRLEKRVAQLEAKV